MNKKDLALKKLINFVNENIPRLEFFEILENVYWYNNKKLNFFWEQAKRDEWELYNLVLRFLFKKSQKSNIEKAKFKKLLDEIQPK